MANTKVSEIETIDLLPLENGEFYVAIIPEITGKIKRKNLWMFRKGCGIAQYCRGSSTECDSATLTQDGIKALDEQGLFDDIKELLLDAE